MLKVAILDDYQNVSQQFVDLEKLSGKYEFKIFSEPFEDEADTLEQLADFEALLIMRERTPITKNIIYILFFLALFPSIGSYYCWAGAVSIIGANRAGIFLSLIPLFSTVMAITFFNEQFQFFHLIGAILIILGLFLSNKEIKNA